MFTSYRMSFCCVSQNFIYAGYNLMFFDRKNNHLKKNTRESTVIVITKTMPNKSEIDFFWTYEEIQFLLLSANSNFGCYFMVLH